MFENFETILIKLAASLIAGLVVGAEREYRNKSAGLRTIILICLGSTIFTIISIESSHDTEVGRIASNIVTGIGFIGAGAIMRDGLSVSGLTTASTIWVTAALGMAIGVGNFAMASIGLGIVLFVLLGFGFLQRLLDQWHRELNLTIVFDLDSNRIDILEHEMKALKLQFAKVKEWRREGEVRYDYKISGTANAVEKLIEFMIKQRSAIKAFNY